MRAFEHLLILTTTQPAQNKKDSIITFILRRMSKYIRAIRRRRTFVEDIVASRYEGRAWRDSTEREMIADTVK